MKSKVFNPKSKMPFPKLMITDEGIVVLMLESGKGTVVSTIESCYEIGHYSESWAMSSFYDFNGSVTLSNE